MISILGVNKFHHFVSLFLLLSFSFSSTWSKKGAFEEENEVTLDKVRVINHVYTGKCLIIENKPSGEIRDKERIVLWECGSKTINGLEQSMFVTTKSNFGAHLFLGMAGNADKCLFAGREYYDPLYTRKCNPDDPTQSWIMRRIEGTRDQYQIVHTPTGYCLRTIGHHDGAWIRNGDCNSEDAMQAWRFCTLQGNCVYF